jgi:MFS family permease
MAQAVASQPVEHNERLFWGCFIAMMATSFGFVARALTQPAWAADFHLTATQQGEILGAGLWPFAISIVLFSLIIDQIGYKVAMWIGLICHTLSTIIILSAHDYSMMYLGTFVLALGSGTVEAYANPVVATTFTREKTKWLNRLHGGWAGGLVLGGILAISLMTVLPWKAVIAIIMIPTVVYAIMLATESFPIHERVLSGVSYKDMLGEVGALGCLIATGLVILQLGQVFGFSHTVSYALIALATVAYGVYTRSVGRPVFILFMLIMFPLATTELGVDSWISTFMGGEMGRMGLAGGWVLVYTSAIMLVLRFFAGGIAHKISPLGLLTVCSGIAALGLFTLSSATGGMILLAATLYGIGKTFFWPTTLAVVGDQFPRGGALTMNVVSGTGLLAAGIAGAPFMGYLQDTHADVNLQAADPALHSQITQPKSSIFGEYNAINPDAAGTLAPDKQTEIANVQAESQKDALRTIALLPVIMMVFFGAMALFFRSRGGYRPAEMGTPAPARAAEPLAASPV